MKLRRSTLGIAFVSVLLAAFLLPAATAGAATTYEVGVGQFIEGAPAESDLFFPGKIEVHTGDELHFTSESFHTATLLPVGAGPVDWIEDNAALGSSEPYSLAVPDPDDGPTAYKFGNAAIFPTDSTCGGAGQPACSFNGTSVLNSGISFFATGGPMDFTATVGASAGGTFYVVCIVHGSNMRLRVDVVGNAEPASDPDRLDKENQETLAQATASALALHAKFSALRTYHEEPDGTVVWDAWAGVDSRHVSLFAMYPAKLVVDKGDTVQWHFDDLWTEDHTVTFPLDIGREIARNTGVPVCDPDGDAGPGPDNPPDLTEPPFCSVPTQLEGDFDDRFVFPDGNGTFRGGDDLSSSGVLGATSILGNDSYELTFGALSGKEPFKYLCLIHPFMRGKVVVVG